MAQGHKTDETPARAKRGKAPTEGRPRRKKQPSGGTAPDTAPPAGEASTQAEAATVAEALRELARIIEEASSNIAAFARDRESAAGGESRAAAYIISGWSDDPYSSPDPTPDRVNATPIDLEVPVLTNRKLTLSLSEEQPPLRRHDRNSAEFRYWVTMEALARGIKYWEQCIPPDTTWRAGSALKVRLNEPTAYLNAYYSRIEGLTFQKKKIAGVEINLGESADIVAHELGHAILDAIRPQLWNVAETEVDAFHESFGDISAILCALQLRPMRETVLRETAGNLKVTSRLSRIGEQFGWGLRQLKEGLAEPDCLRNAANRHFYKRPDLLDPTGPASILTSEGHSFSRVFTGAFLDALAEIFELRGSESEAELQNVSLLLGRLLVRAIRTAPISRDYFSQVAAALIEADRLDGGAHTGVLVRAFVNRGIISVDSTFNLGDAPAAAADAAAADAPKSAAGAAPEGEPEELPTIETALNGIVIRVHAPVEKKRYKVAGAAPGAADAADGASVQEGTAHFLKGLIQRRELDLEAARTRDARGAAYLPPSNDTPQSRLTHRLVPENGDLVLLRQRFDCGFCAAGSLRCEG